jgi:hypothetical protein
MHEAEIKRLSVSGQPVQKSLQDPTHFNGKMLGMVACTCYSSNCRNLNRRIAVQVSLGKK